MKNNFDNEEFWNFFLGLKSYEENQAVDFQEPVESSLVMIEKEIYEWIIKKLSGISNLKIEEAFPFVYNRMDLSIFQVFKMKNFLKNTEIEEFVYFILSEKLISYQMLDTLFQELEEKLELSRFISERSFSMLREEVRPVENVLKEDENWKKITHFLSNYALTRFVKAKKIFPLYLNFMQSLESKKLKMFFQANPLDKVIFDHIEPKNLVLFLTKIKDSVLSRAFSEDEWKGLEKFVSQRTYQRIEEDRKIYFQERESHFYKLEILKIIVQAKLRKNPVFVSDIFSEMKTQINILFDKTGAFRFISVFNILMDENQRQFCLKSLTAYRYGFIKIMNGGSVKRKSPVSRKEEEAAENRFLFLINFFALFPDLWVLL